MTEFNAETAERLKTAGTIVVPSGKDYEACIKAARENYNIDAPDFPERIYETTAGNVIWRQAKGKDVAKIVRSKNADIGLTGTDWLDGLRLEGDYVKGRNTVTNLKYQTISEAMCYFALLARKTEAEQMIERVESADREARLTVVTARRDLLFRKSIDQKLNIDLWKIFEVSGTVEGEVGWLAEIGADLVETGETAEKNKLDVIRNICEVYPAAVWAEDGPNPEWVKTEACTW